MRRRPRRTAIRWPSGRAASQVHGAVHVLLNIAGRPREQAALPPERWLTQEGYNQAASRMDRLEEELNSKYNVGRHELHWNRKAGKTIGGEDEGIITCLRCRRWWRWKDRVNNLPRVTVCRAPQEAQQLPSAPASSRGDGQGAAAPAPLAAPAAPAPKATGRGRQGGRGGGGGRAESDPGAAAGR